MDRNFALPIALAAALHGWLLFGTTRGPAPAPPLKEVMTILTDFRVVPPEEPPEPIQSFSEGEKGAKENLVPASAETVNPPKLPTDIAMPVTLKPEVNTKDIQKIGLPSVGRPDGEGGPAFGSIVNSALLDNPPRTRVQISPVYPPSARRDGLNGRVVVEFTVNESGHVIDPRVVESTDRIFEEPSLRAVAKWRFEPGKRHGRIVQFRMAVPLEFRLGEE